MTGPGTRQSEMPDTPKPPTGVPTQCLVPACSSQQSLTHPPPGKLSALLFLLLLSRMALILLHMVLMV